MDESDYDYCRVQRGKRRRILADGDGLPTDYAYTWHSSSGTSDGDGADEETGASSSNAADAPPRSPKKKLNPFLSESDVASRCFARENHIYFFSGVSKDSVYRMNEHILKINQQFKNLQMRNPTVEMTPKPIFLHINSYGGGVFAAFAAIDFIQQSPIPVHTIVEGATASAGTLMSVVGKKRYIRPHASMLIHQLRGWFGGKMTEVDDEYKNLDQMHKSIKSIYSQHTGIADERLDELLKHDLWWLPEKCIKEKLVDEIWTED